MSPGLAAAVAAPVGAVAGLAAGWLAVVLERVEGLEREEQEERALYLRERAATPAAEGAVPSAAAADTWSPEPYGWTWRERFLCPLLGAAGFAAFAAHEGPGRGLYIHCLWLAVLVHVLSFDLKHRLILNRVTYPAIVVALGLAVISPGLTIVHAIAGAVCIGVFFVLMHVLSRGGIGLGDAKLGAFIGATCGVSLELDHIGAVYAVIYAMFLGGAAALVLLVLRLRGMRDPIPYGPFLCAGAALILYLGP